MNRNQAGFLTSETAGSGPRLPVDGETVRNWFGEPGAVHHYARAVGGVGLWRSEERLFRQLFPRDARLLDLGCGAGRIALGLWRLGYGNVTGVDFCAPMIEAARELAGSVRCPFGFEVGDATGLRFETGAFGGAIFGFNGLMQIPGRGNRRAALRELHRVCSAGAPLLFTSHDRDSSPTERALWRLETLRWVRGEQDPRLVEFGDRYFEDESGRTFMHLPDRAEVREDLAATGWRHAFDAMRNEIVHEARAVREFSDECRFWLAHRA